MPGILARIQAAWTARRAEHAFSRGEFEESARLFERSLEALPAPPRRVKRGVALWVAGRRREGTAEAEAGAEALPPEHPARLYLALIRIAEGRPEEARPILEPVAAADPGNLFAAGLRALGLLAEGRGREAARLLEPGVFGSPVFRALLLLGVEKHLRKTLDRDRWAEAYVEAVL